MLLKYVISCFQLLPEGVPRRGAMLCERFRDHFEWEHMHFKLRLAVSERRIRQRVNFLDVTVGHRVAPYGDAIPVHHQGASSAAVCAIVGVRISQVEREMELAGWIQLRRPDRIKPFRTLSIPFAKLRPKISGESANWIRSKKQISTAIVYPEFEFSLCFENADVDWRSELELLRCECCLELWRKPSNNAGRSCSCR